MNCQKKWGFFMSKNHLKKKKPGKQIPLKKTLLFLFSAFVSGIAKAVFRRKHTK